MALNRRYFLVFGVFGSVLIFIQRINDMYVYINKQTKQILNSNQKYRVSVICTPKKHIKKYKSMEDFWKDRPTDEVASKLNDLFLQKGQLISIKSKLTTDKSSVILTKEYKTFSAYQAYHKKWNELSNHNPTEKKFFKYTEIESVFIPVSSGQSKHAV